MTEDIVLPSTLPESDEELVGMESEIAQLQQTLDSLQLNLPDESFHALAKRFFETPPATSLRKAEMSTGIRRKRLQKILDGEITATDNEVSLLSSFIMKELDLLDRKRKKRLAAATEKMK